MHKGDKLMISSIAAFFAAWLFIIFVIVHEVSNAGGLRAVVVEFGREIRSIAHDIQDDSKP